MMAQSLLEGKERQCSQPWPHIRKNYLGSLKIYTNNQAPPKADYTITLKVGLR